LSIVKRTLLAQFLLLLLAGCGGAPAPAAFAFPETVGGWKLKQAKELSPTDAPDAARRLGLKRARVGEYEGSGRLEAELYDLTSDAAALEMEQTWKPAADTVAFHEDSSFVVIRWQSADRAAVSAFVREIEKRLRR
jgi:hypothetical protein